MDLFQSHSCVLLIPLPLIHKQLIHLMLKKLMTFTTHNSPCWSMLGQPLYPLLSTLVYVGAAPLHTSLHAGLCWGSASTHFSPHWSMLGQPLYPLLSLLVYVGAAPLPTLSFQLKGTFLRCIYTDQYLCSLWEKHLLPNGELPFAVPLIVSPYLCLAHWFSCSICSTYGSYT